MVCVLPAEGSGGESLGTLERLVGPHDPSSEALSCSSVPCRQQRGQQLHLFLRRQGRASCRDPPATGLPLHTTAHPPGPCRGRGRFRLGPEANTVPRGREGGRSCRVLGVAQNQQGRDSPYPKSPLPRPLLNVQAPGTPPSASKLCHSSLTSGGPELPASPPSF